jgi:hypothetical protein
MARPPYLPPDPIPVPYFKGRKYRVRTTPWHVKRMRELYWQGIPCKSIARLFNLSYNYAWQIVNFYRLRKAEGETQSRK